MLKSVLIRIGSGWRDNVNSVIAEKCFFEEQQYLPKHCRRVMYGSDLGLGEGSFYMVEVAGCQTGTDEFSECESLYTAFSIIDDV